jgi:hypothetical protein
MSNLVIVAHPETKELYTETNKKDFFKCQVREIGTITVNKGVINSNDRVAFPLLPEKVIKMPAFANLKDGSAFPVSGKIQRVLSLEPQFEGHQTVKKGSEPDAEEALMNGQVYYSQYIFTDNMNAASTIWVDGDGKQVVESLDLISPEEKAAKEAAGM